MKNKQLIYLSICYFLCISSAFAQEQMALPKYSLVDKLGVNGSALQINSSLDTLSIGGSLGLSHSISITESSVLYHNGTYNRGGNDKFAGVARYDDAAPNGVYVPLQNCDGCAEAGGAFRLMTVQDDTGSAEFMIRSPSGPIANGKDYTVYTYEALRDKRNTLVVSTDLPGRIVWTQPSGKKATFNRTFEGGAITAGTKGYLEKIEYPNGYTISIDRDPNSGVLSVSNNTGFQLKYNYFWKNHEASSVYPGLASIQPENAPDWARRNPHSIVGINSAYERCDKSESILCLGSSSEDICPSPLINGQTCRKLTKAWPKASFEWPLAMPRAVYDNTRESTFRVTDSKKGVTEYYIRGFDTNLYANGDVAISSVGKNNLLVPRLMGIKHAGSSIRDVNYSYSNNFGSSMTSAGYGGAYLYIIPLVKGWLSRAWGINGDKTYTQPTALGDGSSQGGGNLYAITAGSYSTTVKVRRDLFGAVARDSREGEETPAIENIDGKFYFSQDYANQLNQFIPYGGPVIKYGYDCRGNVDTVTSVDTVPNTTTVGPTLKAFFPGCDNPTTSRPSCDNPKTCNQPVWTKDGNGSQTNYTYHAASGQVETVTLPANKLGQRAQTRYEYTPLSAKYYDGTGNKITGSPIYLKTAERYCIKTSYVGTGDGDSHFTGSCGSGDQEVVTRYEYNSDNLFLTGMTVTADAKVKRTCFQYDIYGNQIGKTEPNANLASCN